MMQNTLIKKKSLCSDLRRKAHVIPPKVGDPQQNVATFEPVEVKLVLVLFLLNLVGIITTA